MKGDRSPLLLSACLITLLLNACRSTPLVPGQWVVIAPNLASAVLNQCSRPTPAAAVTGNWLPTEDDIRDLEAHLPALERLKAALPCCIGCRIGDINLYYRQYLGVVINGRRLIYINAVPASMAGSFNVCDGGDGFWGALYDPQTKVFRELAFNMAT